MLTLEFTIRGRRWTADVRAPQDLAIPLDFRGPQPSFFSEARAASEPLRAGGFTGDVTLGAGCNCSVYSFAPHCHGTHTEGVGHVTRDGRPVARLTPVPPTMALVLTVRPEPLGTASHARPATGDAEDPVITRAALSAAAGRWLTDPWAALVVRTLPNDQAKRHRQYQGGCPAPYFTEDAMRWIVERDVSSLVVDLPSLDRAADGGALAAHRVFWGLAPGVFEARHALRPHALVTELAYVPDALPDGLYLLDLQVAAFEADAAPSRPVLYPLAEVSR
jgi:kynurenine formamidase